MKNDEIKRLTNLEFLDLTKNHNITFLNHLVNLKILYTHTFGCNRIINEGIKELKNLEKLFIGCSNNDNCCEHYHSKLTVLNHFTKLKVLSAKYSCSIDDFTIKNLYNLETLIISNNCEIATINHLTKLKALYAEFNCGVNDKAIKNLYNLEQLFVDGNKKITNINHLIKLKILSAKHDCGINDNGISCLINLEELYSKGNKNIKNIENLTNLKNICTKIN